MSSGATFDGRDSNGVPVSVAAEVALSAAVPYVTFAATGSTVQRALPDHLAFVATTQRTQELAGAPTDLPVGHQRIVWNTTKNRPSCWMNRAGTIIDAFDPGTF